MTRSAPSPETSVAPSRRWALIDTGVSAGVNYLSANGPGELERVYATVGGSASIQVSTNTGSAWESLDLTARLGGPEPNMDRFTGTVTAAFGAARVGGTLVAFTTLADNDIYVYMLNPGQDWLVANLTQVSGGTSLGFYKLVRAYSTAIVPSDQVVYVDHQQHLVTIQLPPEPNSWAALDLTAAAGAPPLPADATTIAGAAWDDESQQSVYWVDDAGAVHAIAGRQQGFSETWQAPWHTDLTSAITPTPPPATTAHRVLSASTWGAGKAKRVVYVATDNHIYELSSTYVDYTSETWTATDVTAAVNTTPMDILALVAFDWPTVGEKHIAYITSDGHVHDLAMGPDGQWRYADLTHQLGAPNANGQALTGYGLDQGLAIAFVGFAGHLSLFTQPATSLTAPAPPAAPRQRGLFRRILRR